MVFSGGKACQDRTQPPSSEVASFISFASLEYESEVGDSGVISKLLDRVKNSLSTASITDLSINKDITSNFYKIPSINSAISLVSNTSIPANNRIRLKIDKNEEVEESFTGIDKAFTILSSDIIPELEPGEEPMNTRVRQLKVTNKSSFGNIVSRLRGEGVNKDYWMQDEHCKECYECKEPFTAFKRKHHCRICGQIFCSKCSSKIIPGERFGYPGLMRVCDYCSSLVNSGNSQDHESLEANSFDESITPSLSALPSIPPAGLDSSSTLPKLSSKKLLSLAPSSHPVAPNSNTPTVALCNVESMATYSMSRLVDTGPVVGFRKMLSGKVNLMSNRSRANTLTEESNEVNILAPFYKDSAEYAKNSNLVSPNLLVDPEIAPFISEDEEEPAYCSWATMPADFVSTESKSLQKIQFALDISIAPRTPIANNEGEYFDTGSVSYAGCSNKGTPVKDGTSRGEMMHSNTDSLLWRSRSPSFRSNIKPRNFMGLNNGGKANRHRKRVNSAPLNVEINAASLQHMRKLLLQILSDLEVGPREGWEKVLMKLFLKLSDSVRPNIKGGDDIDIRQYIKIKKIPGGSPADCEYVNGFVCSKNLAHKRMPRTLKNPRIMILTFSLEYHRVDNQYLSLEPVLAQEREHLKNLVARVVALEPTLVIVGKSVSRLALEFLMKANVAVAFNVKHTVVEAIARFTKADVISSIDKLSLEPRLGRCGAFSLRTFAHELIPGKKKTFMFFEECPKELGCTIVLRGGNIDILNKIKQLTNLMSFIAFNLKLESCLMRDQFALNPVMSSEPNRLFDSQKKDEFDTTFLEQIDDGLVANLTLDQIIAALRPFETKLLSASPFVNFPLPYLLTTMRDHAFKLVALKQIRTKKDFIPAHLDVLYSQEEQEHIQRMPDTDYRNLIQECIFHINAGENYLISNNLDISPFSHQNILVLYFNICKENTTSCQAPEIHPIEYYCKTDVTLGQYLEELCFDSNYVCPSSDCDRPLKLHIRSYVHGNARVTVKIEDSESRMPGINQTILMWSHCKRCKKDTPVVPMSEETWKISFGKYIELMFYRKNLTCRAGVCPHNIHQEHIRLFALSDLVVRFEYESIELLELEVPSIKLKYKSDVAISFKNDDIEQLQIIIVKYWDSVAERLKSVTYENVSASKSDECKQEIGDMIQKMTVEKTYFLQMLQQAYDESLPTDTMILNRVVHALQEKVIEWDDDFGEIATKFFPAKLGSAQFKKLFPERDFANNESDSLTGTLSKNFSLDETTLMVTDRPDEYFKPKLLPILGSSPSSLECILDRDTSHPTEYIENNNPETDHMIFSSLKRSVYRRYSLEMMREFKAQLRTLQRPKLISQGSHPLNLINSELRQTKNEDEESVAQNLHKPSKDSVQFKDLPSPNQPSFEKAIPTKSTAYRRSRLFNPTIATSAKLRNTRDQTSPQDRNRQRRAIAEDQKDKTSNPGASEKSKLLPFQASTSSTKFDKQRIVKKLLSKVEPLTRGLRTKRVGKPVIEIYSNAKDAVTEDSDDEYDVNSDKKKRGRFREKVQPFSLTQPDAFDASLGDEDYCPYSRRSSFEDFIYDSALSFLGKDGGFPPPSPPRSPFPLDSYSDIHSLHNVQGSSLSILHPEHSQIDGELPSTAERLSLMKTITNFWGVGNSANFHPLEYPLMPTEHLFPDSIIIVREDEPSSIIAFTLSSRDYKEKLESMLRNRYPQDSFAVQGESDCEEAFELNDAREMKGTRNSMPDIEEILLKPTGTHIKYQFSEGSTTLFCKIFYAEQFDALRRQCGCEETYLESLARCVKWLATGGKSGAAFLKTRDDRLIMKQISRSEMDAFLKFAPYYFEYLSKAFFHELPTLLAKVFGFYRIAYKNLATGRSMKIDVLIMENLFYQRKISRIFDLKGSTRNRHVQSTGNENEVLLDENLMEFTLQSPLFIREHSKNLLRTSIWNDTLFLFKRNVMDYSLLVGIDEEKHELVIGIVDFIRTFTWDKKLESWVKESGILGGGGKEPTIVSPRQYKTRFREAMERYFLMVPDKFCDPNSIRKGARAAPNL